MDSVRQLTRSISALHERLLGAQRRPLRDRWAVFPHLVGDLATRRRKRVRFEMTGINLVLDTRIIDALTQPLRHLLCNAVDHGIETPLQRDRDDKPREGLIRLKAVLDGDGLHLEISDDGRGIDVAKLTARAQRWGMVSEEQASLLSEAEVLRFSLAPGWTTCATASRQGRGLGLAKTAAQVERLGGVISIHSQPACETTISLKIPYTVADDAMALPRVDGKETAEIHDCVLPDGEHRAH
jgi:chemotaxis protein histidine kinase CheA